MKGKLGAERLAARLRGAERLLPRPAPPRVRRSDLRRQDVRDGRSGGGARRGEGARPHRVRRRPARAERRPREAALRVGPSGGGDQRTVARGRSPGRRPLPRRAASLDRGRRQDAPVPHRRRRVPHAAGRAARRRACARALLRRRRDVEDPSARSASRSSRRRASGRSSSIAAATADDAVLSAFHEAALEAVPMPTSLAHALDVGSRRAGAPQGDPRSEHAEGGARRGARPLPRHHAAASGRRPRPPRSWPCSAWRSSPSRSTPCAARARPASRASCAPRSPRTSTSSTRRSRSSCSWSCRWSQAPRRRSSPAPATRRSSSASTNYIEILTVRGAPLRDWLSHGSFYLTLLVTVAVDGRQRRRAREHRARARAPARAAVPATACNLPGSPHPPLGGAVLRDRARVEGHVPPAVRRRERDPRSRSAPSRSPGSRSSRPRSRRTSRPTCGSASRS